MTGVHGLRTEGARVMFDVDTDALEPALRTLVSVGVRSLVSQPPTLEELFLRQYRGDGQGRGERVLPAPRDDPAALRRDRACCRSVGVRGIPAATSTPSRLFPPRRTTGVRPDQRSHARFVELYAPEVPGRRDVAWRAGFLPVIRNGPVTVVRNIGRGRPAHRDDRRRGLGRQEHSPRHCHHAAAPGAGAIAAGARLAGSRQRIVWFGVEWRVRLGVSRVAAVAAQLTVGAPRRCRSPSRPGPRSAALAGASPRGQRTSPGCTGFTRGWVHHTSVRGNTVAGV